MKLNELEKIDVEGIDMNDYPDFTDAYISYAEYDGKELNDEELDEVNENSDFVYECVMKVLF